MSENHLKENTSDLYKATKSKILSHAQHPKKNLNVLQHGKPLNGLQYDNKSTSAQNFDVLTYDQFIKQSVSKQSNNVLSYDQFMKKFFPT